jgi:DNA-binding NtrC family response regulator
LENAVETAVALGGERESLEPSDFPLGAEEPARVAEPRFRAAPAFPDEGLDFEREVGRFERSLLEQALRKAGGNKTAAADMLRLKRTTLSAKLRSLESAWPGADSAINAQPAMNMVQ